MHQAHYRREPYELYLFVRKRIGVAASPAGEFSLQCIGSQRSEQPRTGAHVGQLPSLDNGWRRCRLDRGLAMRTKKIDHLSEDAIHHLVDEFYARIRVDPDLGPVFADRPITAAQTVRHSTAAAFQQIGVQRFEALERRDWYEEVPSRIADEPFDFALVVAFARPAEPILEQVVRLQLGEHARALPLAITEDAGHRDLGVVIQDRLWNPAEECERPNVAVTEGFRRLSRIADHKAGIRVRQVKSEEVDLALDATNDADGFTKVYLG